MSSSLDPAAAVCVVISKLQRVSDTDLIEQCWELLIHSLKSWLAHCISAGQQRGCFEEITHLKRYSYHEVPICRVFGEAAVRQGNLVDANSYFSRVITVCNTEDTLDPDLFETVSNIRNTLVVRWSFRMLNDIRRNHCFQRAISTYLAGRQGCRTVVLDVGAGSGILSLYCAAAGASTVFAVEQDLVVCELGRGITESVASVEFRNCSSEEFDIESNHVDLVVTETLDSIGIGEGIVSSCRDLAERSLNKNIQFIPSQVTLHGFLIQSQTLHLNSFCGKFRTSVGTTSDPYCCEFVEEYTDLVKLSNPAQILRVKLGNTLDKTVSILSLPVLTSGYCDGVCSYFTAHLDSNNTLTTAPRCIDTTHTRAECWEQGFHPLPRRHVTAGEVVDIKVEMTEVSVMLSWLGDNEEYSVVEPNQIKLLNSNLARSCSNELLHVVPNVLDVGGLILKNPFKFPSISSVLFRGVVVHSKTLLSWSRVTPVALCLQDTSQSELLSSEVNKYRTLVHEHVPWSTLEHTKLSDHVTLLRVNRGSRDRSSNVIQFENSSGLPPTALVFWTELEFSSGVKFCSGDEPLWRPAAILFGREVEKSESYRLSVCFSGTSLIADITAV